MADDNVINFPPVGFSPPLIAPADTTAEASIGDGSETGDGPVDGLVTGLGPGSRRSPLETLAALRDPSLLEPVIALPGPEPGVIPDTFRSGQEELAPPPLGALSIAAVLAVSVAAVRGIHQAVAGWRASREQRQAVEKVAASPGKKAMDAATTSRGKLQPAHEWARTSASRPSPNGSPRASRTHAGSRGTTHQATISSAGTPSRGGGTGGRDSSASRRRSRSNGGTDTSGQQDRLTKTTRPRRPGPVHRPTQGGPTTSRTRMAKGTSDADTTEGATTSRRWRRSPKAAAGPKGNLRRGGKPADGTGKPRMKAATKPGTGKPSGNGPAPQGKRAGGPDKGKAQAAGPGAKGKATGKRGKKPGGPAAGAQGNTGAARKTAAERVTLGTAIGNEFERRWKHRKKNRRRPIIWAAPKKKAKKTTPGPTGQSGPQGASSTAPGAGQPHGAPGRNGPGGFWRKTQQRAREHYQQRRADSGRRTPWESAAAASDTVTITVERVDRPGDQEQRRRGNTSDRAPRPALGVAPPPPARPGTTAPAPIPSQARDGGGATFTKGAGMSLPANAYQGGTPAMAAEHETDITLDDTLKVLERLTKDGFSAHDASRVLAEQARVIRHALDQLAADLMTRHNVIGTVTSAAMARLAEAMELLHRKAVEMMQSSLEAAELSEQAEQAMFDAYMPVQQATADAGLAVPSARIHNEG